jgi:hypothetical protein
MRRDSHLNKSPVNTITNFYPCNACLCCETAIRHPAQESTRRVGPQRYSIKWMNKRAALVSIMFVVGYRASGECRCSAVRRELKNPSLYNFKNFF